MASALQKMSISKTLRTACYLIGINFLFCSCGTVPNSHSATNSQTLKARITFYHKFEDKWGSKTSLGIRAKEGITIAAPPSMPFGLPVAIPKLKGIIGTGEFIVQDRGRKIRGSHLDVYVECATRREARKRLRYLQSLDPFMEISL